MYRGEHVVTDPALAVVTRGATYRVSRRLLNLPCLRCRVFARSRSLFEHHGFAAATPMLAKEPRSTRPHIYNKQRDNAAWRHSRNNRQLARDANPCSDADRRRCVDKAADQPGIAIYSEAQPLLRAIRYRNASDGQKSVRKLPTSFTRSAANSAPDRCAYFSEVTSFLAIRSA